MPTAVSRPRPLNDVTPNGRQRTGSITCGGRSCHYRAVYSRGVEARILNPHRTVTSNGDLMPWIGSNVPVATESSTRRCPVLILSPVLLLLVAVVSDKLWALGTDNGRVRFETAGESWQCKGTHSSRSWQLLQNQLEPGADSSKSDVRTFSRLESKMTSSYGSCSSRRLCL
uniref:(northern house mosquito) hypothetical protein n=1 Tax=Culex pipiens TaxID=7175 RepID=A0A8D8I5E3_CULPI